MTTKAGLASALLISLGLIGCGPQPASPPPSLGDTAAAPVPALPTTAQPAPDTYDDTANLAHVTIADGGTLTLLLSGEKPGGPHWQVLSGTGPHLRLRSKAREQAVGTDAAPATARALFLFTARHPGPTVLKLGLIGGHHNPHFHRSFTLFIQVTA
jgi:hypothetical protein